MGDVLSLIEQAEQNLDRDKAEKLAKKIKKGKGFDLEDFRDQLQQMKNMGGLGGLMDKLPMLGGSTWRRWAMPRVLRRNSSSRWRRSSTR